MTNFDGILQAMRQDGDGWLAHGPENWLQGRTLYGGLSAALALEACQRLVPDLPPLRAGQVAYIGPASQDVRVVPTVLRTGRSVTFVGCDLYSEGKLALRALYTFGAARPSQYQAAAPGAPNVARPEDSPTLWSDLSPAFTGNIHQRLAGGLKPMSGADQGDLIVWVKHKEAVSNNMPSLVALGDALPPASFTRFTQPSIISTMTWNFELFDPENINANQWVLLRSVDDGVGDGYSGQLMDMWGEDGRAILRGRQSVAIFG